MKILVIVESPGKISKISKILGSNYIVKASLGHFRDLDPKTMSIDFNNHFEPIYIMTKPDVAKNLRAAAKSADMVYIAADEDREGEAIAQSIYDVLKPKKYKRLVFNSITKTAITNAVKNAGDIQKDLVCAQKGRRIIDRLFGYLISPILQRQLGGKLSAGRVQSVAVRIIIDKENEIRNFLEKNQDSSYFKVGGRISKLKVGLHLSTNKNPWKIKDAFSGKTAQLPIIDGDNPNIRVITFMKKCLKSVFRVHSVADKVATRSAAPPFTTSTLQQEANRKFGMQIESTMKTAQKLYEAGYITYMRTDSVELSEDAQKKKKKVIEDEYGKEYYQKNVYKNKSAGSQEAHEAIRPTHLELMSLESEIDDDQQIKLYKLIWQRTIASQMKPAKINITTIQITISKFIEEKIEPFYYFQSQIEKIIFEGFMKVYTESTDDPQDDDNISRDFKEKIPKVGDKLVMEDITAKQEYLRPACRYTQASLVKKLDNMGIGRPATYVNTIKTIMDREYIKVDNVPGIKKDIMIYSIKSENKKHVMRVFEEESHVLLGKENKKIIPTQLGISVNDFLLEHFTELIDYNFTAKMEEDLDQIASGNKIWYKIVQKFYDKLNPIIQELSANGKNLSRSSEKSLGKDKRGVEIFAGRSKHGPYVRKEVDGEPVYADIIEPYTLDKIKRSEAIKLFKTQKKSDYPKLIGKYEKKDVALGKGKYGVYIIHNGTNYSLPEKTDSDIELAQAIKIIKEKDSNKLGEFEIKQKGGKTIKAIALKGRGNFSAYVQVNNGKTKKNYPIPKNYDPKKLTNEQILEIISTKGKSSGSKSATKGKSSGSKNSTKGKSSGSKSATK